MKPLHLLVFAIFLLAAYLLAWPVPINPVSWDAPPAPRLAGPYQPNDYLASVHRFGERADSHGPEDTAISANGEIYTGWADGQIWRYSADGRTGEVIANTGGRPLGLAFGMDERLYIADAKLGLLRLEGDGSINTLLNSVDGIAMRFTDDLDVAPNGLIYVSDASSKWGYGEHREDILEHGGRGRLIEYNPANGKAKTLLSGLNFANGVAVGPNGEFVLVNETGSYQVIRYWLTGPKAGTSEPLIRNLPGFPDNLSFDGQDTFWIALYAPRNAQLDSLSDRPWMRSLVYRLPEFAQPTPKPHAMVLGVDTEGRLLHNLQDPSEDCYSPITSVEAHRGRLFLGSLGANSLAVIRAPKD